MQIIHRTCSNHMPLLGIPPQMRALQVLATALFVSIGLLSVGCGDEESSPGNDQDISQNDGTALDDTKADDITEGDTTEGDTGNDDTPEAAPSTTLVAYNVGLAPNFVPWSLERVALVANALASLQADVLCLSEVWLESDRQAILQATAEAFPHSFFHVTEEEVDENAGAACTLEEADPLFTCVLAACSDTPNLVACVLDNCGAEFASLSPECLGCVSANVGSPLEEILSLCTEGSTAFAYGGHNGLLLLSAVPIQGTAWTALDSSLVQRVALSAKLPDGLGVICTHLAADLSGIQAYTGPYESFENEQRIQIEQLLAFGLAQHDGNSIWLGDFNTGPAAGSAQAELPNNWALLAEQFVAPYLDNPEPLCTFCADNPLVSEPEGLGVIIDHALLRGSLEALRAARILDEPIEIPGRGANKLGRLSDHYGVLVEVKSAPAGAQ